MGATAAEHHLTVATRGRRAINMYRNLNITLDNNPNDGRIADSTHPGEGENVHGDVENVIGGGGNDKITGNDAVNITALPVRSL